MSKKTEAEQNARTTPAKAKKEGMTKFLALTKEKGGEFLSPLTLEMEPGDLFVGELITVEVIKTQERVKKGKEEVLEDREYNLYHFKEVDREYFTESQERGRVAMSGGVNFVEQMKTVKPGNIIAVLYEGKVKTASKRKVNVYKVSNLSVV